MDGIVSTGLPIAMIGALCYTLVNFLRYLSAKEWQSALSIGILWVAGFVTIMVLAASAYAGSIAIFGITLSTMNIADKIIIALLTSSLYSPVKDLFKSIDNTQSGVMPAWGGDPNTDSGLIAATEVQGDGAS